MIRQLSFRDLHKPVEDNFTRRTNDSNHTNTDSTVQEDSGNHDDNMESEQEADREGDLSVVNKSFGYIPADPVLPHKPTDGKCNIPKFSANSRFFCECALVPESLYFCIVDFICINRTN